MLRETKLWKVTVWIDGPSNTFNVFETFYVVADDFDRAMLKAKEYPSSGRHFEVRYINYQHDTKRVFI